MKKPDMPISGQLLVADYQSAYISFSTAEIAKYRAEQTEGELLSQMSSMSGGGYLNPANMDVSQQINVTKASLNAHVQKVQAEQLGSISATQLHELNQQDNSLYIGRKVQVDVINNSSQSIESVWFNQYSGYRSNVTNKNRVRGFIKEISLLKNILVVKPMLSQRIINKEFQAYFVYIVDPDTAQPLVELTLL